MDYIHRTVEPADELSYVPAAGTYIPAFGTDRLSAKKENTNRTVMHRYHLASATTITLLC